MNAEVSSDPILKKNGLSMEEIDTITQGVKKAVAKVAQKALVESTKGFNFIDTTGLAESDTAGAQTPQELINVLDDKLARQTQLFQEHLQNFKEFLVVEVERYVQKVYIDRRKHREGREIKEEKIGKKINDIVDEEREWQSGHQVDYEKFPELLNAKKKLMDKLNI